MHIALFLRLAAGAERWAPNGCECFVHRAGQSLAAQGGLHRHVRWNRV